MKSIRIWFDGLGTTFNMHSNFITDTLKKRYNVILDQKNPEYLFFSEASEHYLDYPCVRIFYTIENVVPDFNICDYGIASSLLQFDDRYIRYPLYLVDCYAPYRGDNYALDLLRAQHKHENVESTCAEKTDFCAFVYSNQIAVKCREQFFYALSDYKKVNSGGRFLNNIGGPVENKLDFQRRHKFVIAFENSSTPGYTTEKIVHAFSAGAVPIYWGNPEISREFNPESFIDCNAMGLREDGDERIIQKIVERVKEIDQNDVLYRKMLSTPAFTKENNVERQNSAVEDFLFHIVEQDIGYRRNRFYIGERYERRQRIGNAFYFQCRKLIPARDVAKRVLGIR